MKVIRKLTASHRRRHNERRAAWFQLLTSTDPVDRETVRGAVKALFEEVSLAGPDQFLYYPSPAAAFADFRNWQAHTGRCMTCFWPYQLPLCDPTAYWRQWGDRSPIVDLSTRRRPNKHGCYAFGEQVDKPGATLSAEVLRELWTLSAPPRELDWCSSLRSRLFKRFRKELCTLSARIDAEDPTCQAHPDELYILGPLPWLLQEVACADSCATVLGCRRNEGLYRPLEQLLTAGSVLFVFERLCIVCERPTEIGGAPLTVRYADGFELRVPPVESPGPDGGFSG